MVDQDNNKYRGDWVKDGRSGCKIWLWHGGKNKRVTWSGPCLKGKAHGPGQLVIDYEDSGAKQTDVFEGDLHEGRMHGTGHYRWGNGDQYQGEFHRGRRTGWGIYTWANGKTLEGNWKDDTPHGQGTMKQPGGEARERTWRDGRTTRSVSLDDSVTMELRQIGRLIAAGLISAIEEEAGRLSAQSLARIHEKLTQLIVELGRDPLKTIRHQDGTFDIEKHSLARAHNTWVMRGLLEEFEERGTKQPEG